MKNIYYKYLCDGRACKRMCADNGYGNSSCRHTGDESHAKNKVRRDRKFRRVSDIYWEEIDR